MEIEEIKHRVEELELARPYLNSSYYWNRMKELESMFDLETVENSEIFKAINEMNRNKIKPTFNI